MDDDLFEDEDVLNYSADQLVLGDYDEKQVRSVVEVPPEPDFTPEVQAQIDRIVEGIHRDYDDVVIRKDVPPEYLVPKGPEGLAEGTITIKPGYSPKLQRPIHVTGERREALIEHVQKKLQQKNGRRRQK